MIVFDTNLVSVWINPRDATRYPKAFAFVDELLVAQRLSISVMTQYELRRGVEKLLRQGPPSSNVRGPREVPGASRGARSRRSGRRSVERCSAILGERLAVRTRAHVLGGRPSHRRHRSVPQPQLSAALRADDDLRLPAHSRGTSCTSLGDPIFARPSASPTSEVAKGRE
jgi:hypothetical protein